MSDEVKVNRDDVAGMDVVVAKWRIIPYRGGTLDGEKLWTNTSKTYVTISTTTRGNHDQRLVKSEVYDIITLSDNSLVAVKRI